ncbi:hypothetical protein CRM22_009835 [Opisthorchis felineus]|uniref:WD repeat-containing protein 34 n=1 Tax=Opisthorchis felineus TaxID=147828 RepID=A0A4S2LB61_OPIFE|nr:hypothetical protein CRM22_009835 [Opisthorchis felineus]
MSTMFTDAFVPCVDCDSVETHKKDFTEQDVQTEPYKIIHRGSQSRRVKDFQSQTDEMVLPDQTTFKSEPESSAMIGFLKRAEVVITEELKKSARSRAFRWLQDEGPDRLLMKQTAQLPLEEGAKHELSVTCLSWNSTGAVLGAAYGSLNHAGWCAHNGIISLWNAARSQSGSPIQKLDTNSCVTCLAFHPIIPTLLAAGTFTGEILVYNTAAETECLIAMNGCNEAGHTEGVTQIEWLIGTRTTNSGNGDSKLYTVERFLTIGSDGKIICWTIDAHRRSTLRCAKIFGIRIGDQGVMPASPDILPNRIRHTTNSTHSKRAVSLTSIALCPDQPNRVVVGTDSGGIMLCNLDYPGSSGSLDLSTDLPSPVEFSLRRQNGPICSVDWSKFYRNLVLSCGIGSSLQIHNVLQRDLSVDVDPTRGKFVAAKFSPYFPNVLACTTGTGSVALYSLLGNNDQNDSREISEMEPKLLFETDIVATMETKSPVPKISLAFNTKK